jgi:hypothetical protein
MIAEDSFEPVKYFHFVVGASLALVHHAEDRYTDVLALAEALLYLVLAPVVFLLMMFHIHHNTFSDGFQVRLR